MSDGLPPLSGLPPSEPAPTLAESAADPLEDHRCRLTVDWPPLALSLLAVALVALMAAGVVSAGAVVATLAVGWTLILGLRW
jgi:hypothetical protein